jgi:hypothetical protein
VSVERSVHIDVEIERVGQFDRMEHWRGKLEVSREKDGRVRLGRPTQAGFAAIVFDWDNMIQAIDGLPHDS